LIRQEKNKLSFVGRFSLDDLLLFFFFFFSFFNYTVTTSVAFALK